MSDQVMEGVRSDESGASIGPYNGRLTVFIPTEGGHCCASIDVLDFLKWLREHRPELLKEAP